MDEKIEPIIIRLKEVLELIENAITNEANTKPDCNNCYALNRVKYYLDLIEKYDDIKVKIT